MVDPGQTPYADGAAAETSSPVVYVRQGGRIVAAPADDQAVARGYADWPDKGPVVDGLRLTILTKRLRCHVGEEVRVLHVLEATGPGHELHVMGPKAVHGERIDGRLATAPAPDVEDPWVPVLYDGAVVEGPGVDFNYEITSYTFDAPGRHRIEWQLGALRSNVLEIEVVDGPRPDRQASGSGHA
ncbi:MAG: hypothetical protein KJ066_21880 [Acidobacteria bacterium]|nr:hypothetical protein [Acidobacteriota bacterium]